MIRDGILQTKRHELGNIVASRKRKLQELYHATVAFAGPQEPGRSLQQDDGLRLNEAAFLDVNDILRSRYFDVNTLLRIQGDFNGPAKRPAIPSPGAISGTAASPHGVFLEPTPNHVSDLQAHQQKLTPPAAASSLTSAPRESKQSPTVAPAPLQDATTDPAEETLEAQELGRGGKFMEGGLKPAIETVHPIVDDHVSPTHLPEQVALDETSGLKVQIAASGSVSDSYGSPPKPSRDDRDGQDGFEADKSRPASVVENSVSQDALSSPSKQLQFEAAESAQLPAKVDTLKYSSLNDISNKENAPTATGVSQEGLSAARNLDSPSYERRDASIAMRRSPSKQQRSERISPIRIDTNISRRPSPYDAQRTSDSAISLLPATIQTLPPERMTTRVTSGALRHKSVSEILGDTPKPVMYEVKEAVGVMSSDVREVGTQTPYSSRLVASPDSATFRARSNDFKEKERDRNRPATVVFPRRQLAGGQPTLQSKTNDSRRRDKSLDSKDYLVTLFATQATAQTPSLSHLMTNSSKVLSTNNHYLEYRETQDTRVLKRIYHLQYSNRWSLRQMERSKEPERPLSHLDMLLGEMKWMRTDFREERKWKVAAAKNLASWCAEWVNSPLEERLDLQVKLRKPTRIPNEDSHITPVSLPNASSSSHSETTPELIPSLADDASDTADEDFASIDVAKTRSPAALFSLAPEDVVFSINPTPVADKVLEELPICQLYKDPQGKNRRYSAILDSEWQKLLAPVSKYVTSRMVMKEHGPLRKRSRYEYEEEDEIGHDSSGRTLLPLAHGKSSAMPEKEDVALFNPENKHIISRLHAAHAFRPPSEFNMPSQAFFESRAPSQWTVAEDDQLRKLVREYEYNWSLIAACCSSPSLFSSAAERRTPWECFERWVSFEGLPGDMARHQYFRAWNSRRDGARENLEQLFYAQQQGGNAAQTPARKPRTAEPITVPQRRQSKHVTLAHSMFKLAKKREAALQKQQHVASLAAMRKAAEPVQPRQRMQTPREFSAHKYKQECDYREKQMLYKQQLVASQRAALAQKAAQQVGQQSGSIPPQAGRTGMPSQSNGLGNNPLASLPPNVMPPGSRSMPHPAATASSAPNGAQGTSNQLGSRGAGNVPQASMQSFLQGQQQLPQNMQDRIIAEANRLSEQQRMMQQRQQQGRSSTLVGMTTTPFNGNMNVSLQPNTALLANLQAANGKLSPAASGNPGQSRSSASPGIAGNMQPQQASSGVNPVLNQISTLLKATHPTASPEQIKQMATAHLSQQLRNYQQASSNNSLALNNNMQLSPQQQMAFTANANMMNQQPHAQYMRSQQASQQGIRNGIATAGGGSGSSPNSEANGMRPGSQGSMGTTIHGRSGSMANGASQSPHPPQAQIAGSS